MSESSRVVVGSVDGPDRVETESDEQRQRAWLGLVRDDFALLGVKVVVAPEHLEQIRLVQAELLRADLGKLLDAKRPPIDARREDHVARTRHKVVSLIVDDIDLIVVIIDLFLRQRFRSTWCRS